MKVYLYVDMYCDSFSPITGVPKTLCVGHECITLLTFHLNHDVVTVRALQCSCLCLLYVTCIRF